MRRIVIKSSHSLKTHLSLRLSSSLLYCPQHVDLRLGWRRKFDFVCIWIYCYPHTEGSNLDITWLYRAPHFQEQSLASKTAITVASPLYSHEECYVMGQKKKKRCTVFSKYIKCGKGDFTLSVVCAVLYNPNDLT